MQKIILLFTIILLSGCGNIMMSNMEKEALRNPNDVYGTLAKAESGEKISCDILRARNADANQLASAKGASITEISLPGRYQSVLERYGC